MDIYNILGRTENIFQSELDTYEKLMEDIITSSKFLVIGGAGSIGSAVCEILISFSPKKLHVVDISENNLVELVRKLRSRPQFVCEDFDIYAIDYCSDIFQKYIKTHSDFDYILNLAALKHVRSEKDEYTLLRMIETNIFSVQKLKCNLLANKVKNIFCVSTDKAANPANLMGASKKLMEQYLFQSNEIVSSSARFANVAFSDGSLLHGFKKRLETRQPISIPINIQRFFMTPEEAGYLCIFSCLLGEHGDIFAPKVSESVKLTYFKDILEKFLEINGYMPVYLKSEKEAKEYFLLEHENHHWPCLEFRSDTTGEKEYEEFYTESESRDVKRFDNIDVINHPDHDIAGMLAAFKAEYLRMIKSPNVNRENIISPIKYFLFTCEG